MAALACAFLAARSVAGYSAGVADRYGPLRSAVVVERPLRAGRPIGAAALAVRRVPARFLPPGTFASVAQAGGSASLRGGPPPART